MGLKIKSQIIWILYVPMAIFIGAMCYFNISINESTLLSTASQSTATTVQFVRERLENTLAHDKEDGTGMKITSSSAESLEIFIKSMPDIRTMRIFNPNGEVLFFVGGGNEESEQKNSRIKEAQASSQVISTIWAYRNEHDYLGQPLERPSFIESRTLTYDYYIPFMIKGTTGVLYISFYLSRLPSLLKLITLANLCLVITFLVSTFIAISIWSENAIARPLSFILQAQDRLARGDFDTRVSLDFTHTNELARAYGSFNNMAEDLRTFREELERKNIRLSELNEQYRMLNERLEQEVQEKTKELREFFSLITHDLKVPLAASQGYTELLLKPKTGQLNEKQHKFLQSISMANTHLLHLVRNMLDSVKYDAGKINYFFEPFSLAVLLDEVRSNLHLFLEEKQIELVIDISEECSQVFADRMKIGQVLTNLINNAINVSSPKDTVMVTSVKRARDVEIRISDRGPGIGREKQASIFDKFIQFHEGSKSTGGMGLGLYIVKKILEGHNQRIGLESVPDEGSTFIFSLPEKGTCTEDGEVKEQPDGLPK